MLRKLLKALGWSAAGLVGLCVGLYLVALAINWRDREPSATAIRLTALYRDRPAVADEDNGFVYLQRWEADPNRHDKLSVRLREFREACGPGRRECAAAFAEADGMLAEWRAVDPTLLDRYTALIAHSGWQEDASSLSISGSLPSYSVAMDGQRLLLLRARELAQQGDAATVHSLLERDLQFWRTALQSSDTLISRMIATVAITRQFTLGNVVLRKLPQASQGAAMPVSWRRPISGAERSMVRCTVGEWLFVLDAMRSIEASEDRLTRPLFQMQDTANRFAELYWQTAQKFEVPLAQYQDAAREADELSGLAAAEAAASREIYNWRGIRMLEDTTRFSQYALRVGDIEGVRRAAVAAATLRASGVDAKDVPAALAGAEERDPYTDRPFDWDPASSAIVFRGLQDGERGEHRIYY